MARIRANNASGGGGGGEASGIIEKRTNNQAFTINTGLSQVKRFYFKGIINDTSTYGIVCVYDVTGDSGSDTTQMSAAANNANATVTSAGAYVQTKNAFPSSNTMVPVITNISGGYVTFQPGTSGSWYTISGSWYAYDH